MKVGNIDIPADAIADLCRRYQVRELALFGSVLRPDFRPDSDIDILVDFEPDAVIGLMKFARLQRELSVLLRRTVDLVPKDGLKRLIRDEVLAHSEVVFAQ